RQAIDVVIILDVIEAIAEADLGSEIQARILVARRADAMQRAAAAPLIAQERPGRFTPGGAVERRSPSAIIPRRGPIAGHDTGQPERQRKPCGAAHIHSTTSTR